MKKTKLLIATAALSLAAVAAGTVSTMAWFQATNAVSLTQNGDVTGQITVEGTSLNIGDELQVALNFTDASLTAPTELTADDGKVYYYIDATHVREKTGVETSAKIGSVQYTITWGSEYAEEVRKLANTQSVTFEITTTGRVHLVTAADNITAVENNKLSIVVSVDANGDLSPNSGTVYFRVDGGEHTNGSAVTQDVSNSTQFGTITAAAPAQQSGGGE